MRRCHLQHLHGGLFFYHYEIRVTITLSSWKLGRFHISMFHLWVLQVMGRARTRFVSKQNLFPKPLLLCSTETCQRDSTKAPGQYNGIVYLWRPPTARVCVCPRALARNPTPHPALSIQISRQAAYLCYFTCQFALLPCGCELLTLLLFA